MENGYPISDITKSGYVETNPYNKRDPRLAKYIIYNGSLAGVSNTPIYTGRNSGTDDGINVKEQKSTRTGYYMKKRLRMDVNRAIGSVTNQQHYIPRIRYTEMYLAYAEAVSEYYEVFGNTGYGTVIGGRYGSKMRIAIYLYSDSARTNLVYSDVYATDHFPV